MFKHNLHRICVMKDCSKEHSIKVVQVIYAYY